MTRWWNEHVAAIGDHTRLSLVAWLLVVGAALLGAAWYRYPSWLPWRWWPRRGRSAHRRAAAAPAARTGFWRRLVTALRAALAALWRVLAFWRWRWPHAGWRDALARWWRRWNRLWSWRWTWGPPRWLWRRHRAVPAPAAPVVPAPSGAELPDLPAGQFVDMADELAAQGRYAEAVRERLRAILRELVDAQVIANYPGWTVLELSRAAGSARPEVGPPLVAATRLFSDIWYGLRPAAAEHDRHMRDHARAVHDRLAAAFPVGAP